MTVFPNTEVERALLGGAVLHGRLYVDRLLDLGVLSEHFLMERTRRVWDAILEVRAESGEVDVTSVAALVGDTEHYVDGLTSSATVPETLRTLVRELIGTHTRRRWQDASYALSQAADEGDEKHVETAERLLRADTTGTEEEWTPQRLQSDVFDWLSGDTPVAVTTGFPQIDRLIGGGLRPGDVTALGGWTGMGKSLIVDNMLTAAVRSGRSAHLFINEMSPRDRALRLIAQQGAAPYARLVVKDVAGPELERVVKASSRIPFGLTECATWTPERIARAIRAGGHDVVALDVLHNLQFRDTRDLDEAVNVLLSAARSSGTHLILVCHLNDARQVGHIAPPPVLRDIRNTGMIARVAATVLMIHRPQQDHGDGAVSMSLEGSLEALKARHGRLGACGVRLDPASLSFIDFGASRLDVAA